MCLLQYVLYYKFIFAFHSNLSRVRENERVQGRGTKPGSDVIGKTDGKRRQRENAICEKSLDKKTDRYEREDVTQN